MKLLVISNLFEPDQGGGAALFSDMCFGLAKRGHDVTVLTTYPYYPEWRRKTTDNAWRVKREVIQGVEVFRYGLHVPARPDRLLGRILYEGSFAVSLLRSLWRAQAYDVVLVFCPLLSAVAFAALRKLLVRDPLWLVVQDIPVDAALASGISRSRAFNALANGVQKWLFRRADEWSSICPAMIDRLESMCRPGQRIHLCENWLHNSLADQIAGQPDKAGRLPSRPIRLLYAGNIGKKQGLLEFCQRLQAMPGEFAFQIMGGGSEAERLRQFVVQSGDARFRFERFRDEQHYAKSLHRTDLFVITEKPDAGASFFPSKLIPGITSGTPLLAVCDPGGPLGTEVHQYQLGWTVSWHEMARVQQLISPAGISSEQFISLQNNCLQRARSYQRDMGIARYETRLQELADSRSRVHALSSVPVKADYYPHVVQDARSRV